MTLVWLHTDYYCHEIICIDNKKIKNYYVLDIYNNHSNGKNRSSLLRRLLSSLQTMEIEIDIIKWIIEFINISIV